MRFSFFHIGWISFRCDGSISKVLLPFRCTGCCFISSEAFAYQLSVGQSGNTAIPSALSFWILASTSGITLNGGKA
jgi:hypothetical protein